MRMLILSCNTGEGHNSAAKALKDCFDEQHIDCEIRDALAFWSPEKSKLISKGHVFIYRKLPKLFGVSYRFEENHMKEGNEGLIYDLVTKGCDSLAAFLEENPFDAIICTHVFSAMMVTDLKKRRHLALRSYFVATDYTCSPGVNQTFLDRYFIPHEKLIAEFAGNGIPKERLFASGIPVRKAFYHAEPPEKAKKSLSLPPDKQIALLMCGSMGCGPIKDLADNIRENLPENAMLVVICGNNKRLYKAFTKNPPPDNMRVIGYTTRMSLYMDAASLILTKPGGLSSTEAAVKALPIFFIDAVPGCETRNIEFFLQHGFGQTEADLYSLSKTVCATLRNREQLTTMSDALRAGFRTCAPEEIKNSILKDLDLVYGEL